MLSALRLRPTTAARRLGTTLRVTPSTLSAASAAAAAGPATASAAAGLLGGVRSVRMGWSLQKETRRVPAVKLLKPKARDVRFLLRTLPEPLKGRVRHMREAPVETWVHNLKLERVGLMPLDRDVFGVPVRLDLVSEAIRWQRAKARQGTAKGKNRTEVRGSRRKIRKQKGTGSARQGDGKAPHFVGGGAVFPPVPRSYDYDFPLEARRRALTCALTAKHNEGNLLVIDSVERDSHRAKDFRQSIVAHWPASFKDHKGRMEKSVLVIHADLEMDPNFALATRSHETIRMLAVKDLNCFDIVGSDVVLITQRAIEATTSKLQRRASSNVSFVAPTLYLQPQLGVDTTATANREDFIASLSAKERLTHGNELIKVGENKHIKFVPLTAAERAQYVTDLQSAIANGTAPAPRTFKQIVPGPTGGIVLADVPEPVAVPLTRPVVVDGAPQKTSHRSIYAKFRAWKESQETLAEHDARIAAAKQVLLSRSTLQPHAK